MKNNYLKIVKQIELARSKNNKNWMDLLRLAIKGLQKKLRIFSAK